MATLTAASNDDVVDIDSALAAQTAKAEWVHLNRTSLGANVWLLGWEQRIPGQIDWIRFELVLVPIFKTNLRFGV